MSDSSTAIWVAIISGTATVAASSLAVWVAFNTHKSVNSRMDDYKENSREKYRLEGVIQEKEAEAKRRLIGPG